MEGLGWTLRQWLCPEPAFCEGALEPWCETRPGDGSQPPLIGVFLPTFPHASSPCHRSVSFLSWSLCSPFSSPSLPFLSAPDPFLVAVHPSVQGGADLEHTHICFQLCLFSLRVAAAGLLRMKKKNPAQALQRVKSESRSLRGPGRRPPRVSHCLAHGRHWAQAAKALGPEAWVWNQPFSSPGIRFFICEIALTPPTLEPW